ncbi:MAG: DUF4347 domain-containing protein [Deltaproteobacteria bacterium]|nr:MAG: DUF4347 domain-containing protein [Deltaproteobacteria bacterium]
MDASGTPRRPSTDAASSTARGRRIAGARRIVVFDPTCRGRWWHLGLSHAWSAGVRLYRGMGRIDGWVRAENWRTAFAGVLDLLGDAPLFELQVWSHGKWGLVRLGDDVFDRTWLRPAHRDAGLAAAVFDRLVPGGRIWFRTCETAGAACGQAFVQALADATGVDVYGHTYVIGIYQSGLRRAVPGGRPDWSPWEGLRKGTPAAPLEAHPSRPWHPSTVHFLSGEPSPLA